MATMMKGRGKKRLVLDIGSSAVRLCEITQTKSGYQLTKYLQREYSSDPNIPEEQVKQARVAAINSLLKEGRVSTKKTIFGVPGQSVFTRTRALPPVPEYKVTQIVKYEIQQQIPFSLDQIAMDYQVLDRTDAGGYDVMMAAIKVDVVEKHLDILGAVKRSIDVVDVCPLAAYNWLKHTGEFGDQGDCVALIDIGAVTTDIVIERENQFRFTRPLNVGGNDITRAVSAAFDLNFSDAERLKRQKGFAPTGDPEKDGKGGEVIGQALQRIVSEIMRSFAFFRSLPGGGVVNRVVLTGGGACLRNIVPYLQRQLGVEVRIAQPLAGLAVTPGAQAVNEVPEQACVALGLALRCCQRVPIELNLIPPRVLEAARRKEQYFYWALVLVTLILIMASVIPVKANENKQVLARTNELTNVLRGYDPQLANTLQPGTPVGDSKMKEDFLTVRNRVQSMAKSVNALDDAQLQRTFWLDQLEMINAARPAGKKIWFSNIETARIKMAPQQSGGRGGAGGGPMGMMGAMSMMPGMGGMGMGGRDDGTGVQSTGFPGIQGTGGRGMGGGGADMAAMAMMNPMDMLGGGMGRNRQEREAPKITRPNGVSIIGYAADDQAMRSFVDELKRQTRRTDTGLDLSVKEVHFNEGAVERVDWSVLKQARTTGGSYSSGGMGGGMGVGMMMPGMGMPGMGMPGMGMPGMGMPGMGMGAGSAATSRRVDPTNTILAFTMHVEFDFGYEIQDEAPAARAGGQGGMLGMPGMGMPGMPGMGMPGMPGMGMPGMPGMGMPGMPGATNAASAEGDE